jgi:hypothetical protein
VTTNLLSEPHEWTGKWWLPEQPDQKVAGVLTYDPDQGILLRLIGGWDYEVTLEMQNGSAVTMGQLKQWPLVLGTASNGQAVTLLDASATEAKRTYSVNKADDSPDFLHLTSATLMVGCHLRSPNEAAFVAGAMCVENLTTWSERTGVETIRTRKANPGDRSSEIGMTRLSPIVARAPGLSIKLHHLSSDAFAEFTRAGAIARVSEHASLEFNVDEKQSLDFWNDLAGSAADLLSLSSMKSCGIMSMHLYLPATPESYPEDHPQRNQRPEVQVYQRMVVKAQPNGKAVEKRDFVLTLNDRDFEELMPRWLAIRQKFAAARSMILGLQYVEGGYLENRVVTAVSAAEAMHRALDPEPPIPLSEFKALRKSLLAHVDPARKAWLADRLTDHSNVPTLKERLLDLAERVGAPGSALAADPDQWAKAAKDSRNTIAHVGSSSHELEKLHAVVEVTSGIVILNLLHELGVQEDRLLLAVRQNRRLSRSADLAREFFSTP